MELRVLPGRFAICRLDPAAPVPSKYFSVTRTAGELSVVCLEEAAPAGVRCESGWRMIELQGPFDFALTGILLSIIQPLGEAGISIFAVSTFDTDYVLVRELEKAVEVLTAAGHTVLST